MPVFSQAACGSYPLRVREREHAAASDEHQLTAVDSEYTQPRVSCQCSHRQHAAPIQGPSEPQRGNMNLHLNHDLIGRLGVHGLLLRTGISSFGKSRGLRRCQLESHARGSTLAGCCLYCVLLCVLCCARFLLPMGLNPGNPAATILK
jgi:hypothetical protein